jgi:pimeloyl-ACP methyl ester carboxylesterase
MSSFLTTDTGRRLAYHFTSGTGPVVVFLGGFRSDMSGTKAVFLEHWAADQGRSFLRFDYSGHGDSDGRFEDGCIGDWAEDAVQAIRRLTAGPVVLVGSSMGGWIACLVARHLPDRICGMVGIAPAPDFTEDSMWPALNDAQRQDLEQTGQTFLPNPYDTPYPLTQRLFEDGRKQLVLRDPLDLPFPVRLLHGTKDEAVDLTVPLRFLEHANGPDIRLTLVKGVDHRFSSPDCLDLIAKALSEVLEACPY